MTRVSSRSHWLLQTLAFYRKRKHNPIASKMQFFDGFQLNFFRDQR